MIRHCIHRDSLLEAELAEKCGQLFTKTPLTTAHFVWNINCSAVASLCPRRGHLWYLNMKVCLNRNEMECLTAASCRRGHSLQTEHQSACRSSGVFLCVILRGVCHSWRRQGINKVDLTTQIHSQIVWKLNGYNEQGLSLMPPEQESGCDCLAELSDGFML